MSHLPSTDDATAEQEGRIQVLGINEKESSDVFKALSSDTARAILMAIYDQPAPPSDLADRLDLSIQNVTYHLENLREAGVTQISDTRYSEKGAEMDVYAPADESVIVFIGQEQRKIGLVCLLKRFFAPAVILFLGSVFFYATQGLGGTGGADVGPLSFRFLSLPGFEFLLGGLFALGLAVLWLHWRR